MKFVSLFVASAVAAASAQTTAPPERPPCMSLNLSTPEAAADMAGLNVGVDIATSSGLLVKNLARIDPLIIQASRLNPVPFNILGVKFELTPIIKSLNGTGLSTILPRKLKITGDDSVGIGIDFNGSIDLSATFSFEIKQKKEWWQLCWTNLLKPADCPPAYIDVEADLGLLKPSVEFNTTIDFRTCPKNAPKGTCSDFSASDILIGAITGQFTGVLSQILRRMSSVSISDLSVGLEKITKLRFHFPKSDALITALGQKLLGFTTNELNKKGDLFDDVIDVINRLGNTLINNVIKQRLAPMFGSQCYEN